MPSNATFRFSHPNFIEKKMGTIDNRTNQQVSKRTAILQSMRCVSVFAVTIWLLILLNTSLSTNEWHLITWLALAVFFFFITIPILGFWIYSFIKALITRTKIDNILLIFHIADLLLLGASIYWANHRDCNHQDCNASIMTEYYEMDGDRQEIPTGGLPLSFHGISNKLVK